MTVVLNFPPDDQAEFVRLLPLLLQKRSVMEGILLRWCYLDNLTDADVIKASGLSAETVAGARASLKAGYYSLRDLRQPPHAAD